MDEIGGGGVVKLLASGARSPRFELAPWISEIGYLLLPSRDMTEILLKPRKIHKKKQTQPKIVFTSNHVITTPTEIQKKTLQSCISANGILV